MSVLAPLLCKCGGWGFSRLGEADLQQAVPCHDYYIALNDASAIRRQTLSQIAGLRACRKILSNLVGVSRLFLTREESVARELNSHSLSIHRKTATMDAWLVYN